MTRRRRTRRASGSGGFAWMLVGLTLGLTVAAGVYFSDLRMGSGEEPAARIDARRAPAAGADRQPASTAAEPAMDTAPESGRASAASGRTSNDSGGTSVPQPTEAAAPARQRFEFYDILPQYEVVVPEVETVTPQTAPPAPVASPGSYVLQTGSFRSNGDADRMRANLALLGIESQIQKVTIDDDVFHRVRVGPISDLERLNRIRSQLSGAGIDPLMMKVNE